METSANTQSILLLTSRFGDKSEDVKPLAPKEWGRFAKWLHDHDRKPEQLLRGDLNSNLDGWADTQVSRERVGRLLDRGSALALALEKWYRANLWVITRADATYPVRLKRLLGYESPAVLYGCGNQQLLNRGGLAVVGSRNAIEADLNFTRDLGAMAAKAGRSVVSGGAKGVDQAAMTGALNNEGTGVCVLADSLIRASSSLKYRPHIQSQNLVLLTSFHPDAGFNAGNAMARNKYIYCLSDAAVVVHSGDRGGT
ncbi:MAG: DNA-processing protein DprA, partial [Proteobacteria bacterium]|nr:DNA-processing protein DprA [Pseudomonadota bacterium]